jgi:diguanylate cyclase (GGDEF)-like protein
MRERGFGRIVNVASTSVREPIANLMLSNAHRASMITAFKTIARSVAGDGVTLNTLLPDTAREGGVVLAEKLRRALGALVLPEVDRQITASFGVASLPDDGIDAATLVRAADRALYQAKADGRDRVVAAQIERVMPPSTASVSPVT